MKAERQYHDAIPELEVVQGAQSKALFVGLYSNQIFERSWHHHPEFELILITSGRGQRFVGDHSEAFNEGDLVLLGPQLPHAWISDTSYLGKNGIAHCGSIYVQFGRSLFESGISGLDELRTIENLLQNSRRGIKPIGKARDSVDFMMRNLHDAGPLERLIGLIRMLDQISRGSFDFLASETYVEDNIYYRSKRMNRIHQYLTEHFQHEISLSEVADLVNMTPTSFCRFFKNQSQRTFTEYLNRIRIEFARRLLLNTEMQIKEIGYESGFTSISYFNQTFRRFTGKSPRQFRSFP